jgi:hypothetical protein
MLRRTRQALVVAILIHYGSVSFFGSALHALNDNDSSHASPGRGEQGRGPTLKAPSGHCALCEFQTQGQLPTEPVLVVSRPYTSPHVALILALVASRQLHPSCSPRAPPLTVPAVA